MAWGKIDKTSKTRQKDNCGIICKSPSYQKYNKFETAMNTLIQDDNKQKGTKD